MISDEILRERLAAADPAAQLHAPDLLDRLDLDDQWTPKSRRWGRSLLLAAAAIAIIGLFGMTVVPGVLTRAGSSSTSAIQTEDRAMADQSSSESAGSATPQQSDEAPVYLGGPSIIRTASLLIGAEDPSAAADAFVQQISALGGQVTSQTVVTQGSSQMPMTTVDGDTATMSMPYRTGPGVWVTVQVPVDRYPEALAAARQAGDTVRLEQSSQDVSATVADVDARVRALRSSVAQLRSLMDQATDISEVIALEEAISARQSELDGLRAQQQELLNSTRMSQISLTLMSPEDAAAAVGEQPQDNWTPVRWAFGLALTAAVMIVAVVLLRRRRQDTGS